MLRPECTRAVAPLLALALATAACGGAPAPAKAPSAGGRYDRAETVAVSATADRDGDGIADEADAVPAEPAAYAPAGAAPPPPPSPKPAPQGGAVVPQDQAPEAARDASKIIYTARVTMAVYQVEQGLSAVEKIAKDMGGYLSLKRDREITVRVPRGRFEPALAAIDKIGDVLHRDVQAQDVTDEFVDLEIRIKNARAMQARLKELLERAAVKEALEIEKELHRVTEELERLEGKLKLLKDKIAYSTITVVFEPRGASIQATQIRLPFPWLSQLGLPSLLSLSEDKP